MQSAERHSLQLHHLIADCLQHTLYLMKAAFLNGNQEFLSLQNFYPCRKRRLRIADIHPFFQSAFLIFSQGIQCGYLISLIDMLLRRQHLMCQVTVICKQQQTGSVFVQPSHRKNILSLTAAQKRYHCFVPVILGGGYHSLGFIQHIVNISAILQVLSSKAYSVRGFRHLLPGIGSRCAIDCHQPLADICFYLTSGSYLHFT